MKKLLFTLLLAAVTLPGWAEKYPDVLHVAGNATTAGWLTGTSTLLYQVSEKKYEGFVSFTGTEGGEVKFLCQSGWQDHWGPSSNGTAVSENGTFGLSFCSGGNPDNKFKPTISGLYLVTIDVTTEGSEKATFTKWTSSSVYDIGSLGQLKAFADGVNRFDASINAKLTADITEAMDFAIGWYDSDTSNKLYSGEFDGNGHTVTLAINDENNSNKGLFGAATGGANIHDVIVAGSVTGEAKVAGIVGTTGGTGTITLTNVINTATIDSKGNTLANAAGLIGCIVSNTNVQATNCANTGTISGQNGQCAAFAGWTQSGTTFTNCWNVGEINNIESQAQLYRNSGQSTATNCYDLTSTGNQGTKLDASTLGSGELCYKLNGSQQGGTNWYQNLSGTKDDYPLPFSFASNTHGKVSKSNTCYTNLTVSGGNVQIGTPAELNTFAAEVAAGQTTLNADLTEDIDYSASAYQGASAMIGTSDNKYAGTFDGNNKTVTIGFNVADDYAGLFRYINNGTIKKLKVTGSITTTKQYAGGICARISKNGIITNCESAVTISDTKDENHDGTHGGILALIGDLGDDSSVEVKNCIFSGAFDASKCHGCGGVVGWTGDKSSKVQIKNNLVTGTFNLQDNNDVGTDERKSDVYYRSSATPDNNFYTCDLSNNLRNSSKATFSTEIIKTKGELCYKLNGDQTTINWYQSIGTDAYPVPFNTSQQVYQVVANESYTNFATANINSTTHAVKIGTSAQLEKFSKEVNAGNNAMNAELTADITGVTSHTPIGTETCKYKGTFDGDGKSITFDINTNQDCQALVGYATGGATIKNLILKGTVTNTGHVTAGFIAKTAKSKTTSDTETVSITKCGNEANITGKLGEVAGIVANCTGLNGTNNYNSTDGRHCLLSLNQVYNTGDIKIKDKDDNHDIAAICAYSGNCPHLFVEVYNTGTITGAASGKDNFLRGPMDAWTVTRCYTTNRVVELSAKESDITATQVTSGNLCYKLNNGANEWKQTIGTDKYPKLFGSTGVVNQVVADKSYSNLTVSDDKVEIGSLANLNQFSAEVNAGNVEMDAILTSNITDNGTFTSIGTETYKYKGTFDGDDHYVQLAINKSGTPFQGLFGCATGGAKFKNLIIKGNVNGGNNTAALVGQIGGEGESGTITINRVGCEVNVSGSYEHHGAFVGNDWGGSVKLEVENCYNIGDISGSATYTSVMGSWVDPNSSYTNVFNSGNITGNKFSHQNRGNCTNCYTTTSGAGEVSNLVQGVTSDQITSGKLCYLLNGNTQGGTDWHQTLSGSVDAHPVFFSDHKKVYQYNTSKYVNNGDKVEIGDATDLANFAALVNAGATSVDADQTADIDFSTQSAAGEMIGDKKDNAYSGTYDGQAHEINVTYTSSANNTALFRYISNANLKNIITTGSITTNGEYSCSGGIFAAVENGSDESVVENCLSYVNFIYSDATNRDKTFGGIGAYMRNTGTIQNCAFLGAFDAPNAYGNGGILGYAHSSDVTVKNCYVKASVINVAAKDGDHESKIIVRHTTPSKCYYVTNGNFETQTPGAESVTADSVTSGKLCYDLGSAWYQDLTIDDYPVPFDTHSKVYRRVESSSYSYSNITTGSTVKIKSAKDLIDFSALVNEGNTALNAVLTNDIDMSGVNDYTPIGASDNSKKYKGTFDGQNHYINLNIDNASGSRLGLIGYATAGAYVKNLIIKGSIKGEKYIGGFVGSLSRTDQDGTLTFENCGNEANITATNINAGGLLGCSFDGGVKVVMKNCYNSGTIKGNQSGQLTAWSTNTQIENCYTIGDSDNCDPFARLDGSKTITNCYCDKNLSWTNHPTYVTSEQIASGELCYLLKGTQETNAFTQDLSQEKGHPTFGSKTVTAGKWFNDTENDVYYNEENGNYTVYQLNLNEENTVYNVPANVTATNISVARAIPAGQWIGLCLPFDYDIPDGWDVRELTDVSGSGEDASMKFTTASTIEAGKPYIVKPTAEVPTITATDKPIATGSTNVPFGGVTMVGNLYQTSLTTGDFYINKSSELKKLTADSATLKGFRAYFTVDGGHDVKALSFDFDDDATSLSSISSPEGKECIYNLAGQRINKMQKGINIVNGKKILK